MHWIANRQFPIVLSIMKALLRIINFKSTGQLNFCNWQIVSSHQVRNLSLAKPKEFAGSSVNNKEQNQAQPKSIEKWNLYVGLCVERKPILSQEPTPIEKRYKEFLTAHEFELSKKSDHEKRFEKDKILLEKIKRGELDQGTIETAQDFEDLSTAEALKFVPLSRTTGADTAKDTKSLQRALASHLLLLVQQEIGQNDYRWVCPQLKRNDGENLRQVVDRLIATSFPDIKMHVLGNAPWGYYKYKFSKQVRKTKEENVVGAKIFFYKANYVSGNFTPSKKLSTDKKEVGDTNVINVKDFVWLTRSELKEKLIPPYYKSLVQFLIDED